ncbi:MAG: photosystem I reaction center protein subunit XI [Chroococcidiopsidaceae cyanobacterium CP_BM_ER_R8_30]|nr:photosystem I reaction center protein subunit XI [Chroococcidiopsidaceae cyanobacterium CP_BM_ER_R8_30]
MAQAVNASKDRPSDPRNREVVFPAYGDPQIGNLETPINDSSLSKWFINNLPAYRKGLTLQRRGLEIGMAHGYWLFGPFAKLGPLRDTDIANLAGLLSTIGLVVISAASIALYANSNPPKPVATVTTPNPPNELVSKTTEGWNEWATGFLLGGLGGAVVAYLLNDYLPVIQKVFGH